MHDLGGSKYLGLLSAFTAEDDFVRVFSLTSKVHGSALDRERTKQRYYYYLAILHERVKLKATRLFSV